MTLPIHIAKKLLQLQQGEKIPASSMKHIVVSQLLNDGILQQQMISRGKSIIACSSTDAMLHYLHNRFGISDLQAYIQLLSSQTSSRADAVNIASNSKTRQVRTFKGFLVTCLQPIGVTINGQHFTLLLQPGLFTFVSAYETFEVPADVTIVGVENAENFNKLPQQAYLFDGIKPLFVCRYPYSSDLIKWLQQIPNAYLHFGDFDFAGINIFLYEFYKFLGQKASYFIPPNLPALLHQFGNRALYDQQNLPQLSPDHPAYVHLQPLIDELHAAKKGLEQEVLIRENAN